MSSRFSLEAVVSMVDKVSMPMNKASKSVAGFSKKMQNQFSRTDLASTKLNKSINRFGGKAAKVGLASVGIGAGLVVNEFVKFDDAIFSATAKFRDLDITTKKGQKTMDDLRKTARKIGGETKFNAVEAAQGLDFLAMAGFNTEQSMASLGGVVNLATVANVDLATATDIASDTLGAFNLMSSDSAQLQTNLARVNDVTARTTTMFNTNLEDLFESVKKGGPTFTSAGQSIESFSALVGVMANAGVKGGESGTQLRNIMLRLAAPTGAAGKALNNLGVKIKDSKGNFRDVIDILSDVQKGTKGMGTANKAAALSTIFGARSVTGMNILLAEGTDKLKKHRDALIKSGGSAKAMAKIIEQSAGNKLKALSSAATELGFKIVSAFSGDAKDGITSFTNAISKMDVKPLVETLKSMFAILKFVWNVLSPFAPVILGLVIAFKALVVIQTVYNGILAIAAFKLGAYTVSQIAMSVATSAWSVISSIAAVGTMALGVAFNILMSPITLVILAIGALIAVGVLLYQNWDVVKEFLLGMWDGIKIKFSQAIDWIGNKFTAFIDYFKNKWIAIKQFFGMDDTKTEIDVKKSSTQNANVNHNFASPQSRQMANGTSTTNGNLNINVNAPKGAANVEQSGTMPKPFTLNTGGVQ